MKVKTKEIIEKLKEKNINLNSEQRKLLEGKEELDEKELENITGGMDFAEFIKMLQGYCSSFDPYTQGSSKSCTNCKNLNSSLGYFVFSCKANKTPNMWD